MRDPNGDVDKREETPDHSLPIARIRSHEEVGDGLLLMLHSALHVTQDEGLLRLLDGGSVRLLDSTLEGHRLRVLLRIEEDCILEFAIRISELRQFEPRSDRLVGY